MSLCVARIIIPAWDSGFALDANDASEKAKNLKSLGFMGPYFDGDVVMFLGYVKCFVRCSECGYCDFIDI